MNKTFNTEKMYGYTFNFLALPETNFFKIEFISKIGSNIEREIEQNENRNVYGMAHFIEHLGFRETRDFTSDDLLKALGREGSYNASTTHDRINYWLKTTMERKEAATNIVANIIFNDLKKISQEEFDLEKKVVMNEARMYKDDEHAMFYFNTASTACGMHNEDNIIGDADTIDTFTLEDAIDIKRQLMIGGEKIINVTYDPTMNTQAEVRDMIQKEFASFPVLVFKDANIQRDGPQFGSDLKMANDSDRYLVNLMFDIPSKQIVSSRATYYLAHFADSSLTNIIREKHGLTYNAGMSDIMIWGDMVTSFTTDVTPGEEELLLQLFEESIIESADNFTQEMFKELSETLDLKRTMRNLNLEAYDGIFWNALWGDGIENDLFKTDLEAGLALEREGATYENTKALIEEIRDAVVAKRWCKVTNRS